jgi:hypothetical protein
MSSTFCKLHTFCLQRHCYLDIQAGDYFGLDLLLPIPVPVVYRLIVAHPMEYFANTAIQTSINGKTWVRTSIVEWQCAHYMFLTHPAL